MIAVMAVTKQHILDEIKRTATQNGGVPLGVARFQQETGISEADWFGKYWARWGDALQEAGYAPNKLQGAYDEGFVIEKLIDLIRELKRFPATGDLRMRRKRDLEFPTHNVFRRVGKKAELAQKVIELCRLRADLQDVLTICEPIMAQPPEEQSSTNDSPQYGHVYLLKSGRFYKVGRTNAVGRREYELSIQLPEKAALVHKIKTDDPTGIETYWHDRFSDRRKNGEWFELTPDDIRAFKRRKFM